MPSSCKDITLLSTFLFTFLRRKMKAFFVELLEPGTCTRTLNFQERTHSNAWSRKIDKYERNSNENPHLYRSKFSRQTDKFFKANFPQESTASFRLFYKQ